MVLYYNAKVKPKTGKYKGTILIVSTIREGEFWLRREKSTGLNKPLGPFNESELEEV